MHFTTFWYGSKYTPKIKASFGFLLIKICLCINLFLLIDWFADFQLHIFACWVWRVICMAKSLNAFFLLITFLAIRSPYIGMITFWAFMFFYFRMETTGLKRTRECCLLPLRAKYCGIKEMSKKLCKNLQIL